MGQGVYHTMCNHVLVLMQPILIDCDLKCRKTRRTCFKNDISVVNGDGCFLSIAELQDLLRGRDGKSEF